MPPSHVLEAELAVLREALERGTPVALTARLVYVIVALQPVEVLLNRFDQGVHAGVPSFGASVQLIKHLGAKPSWQHQLPDQGVICSGLPASVKNTIPQKQRAPLRQVTLEGQRPPVHFVRLGFAILSLSSNEWTDVRVVKLSIKKALKEW